MVYFFDKCKPVCVWWKTCLRLNQPYDHDVLNELPFSRLYPKIIRNKSEKRMKQCMTMSKQPSVRPKTSGIFYENEILLDLSSK